MTNQKALVLTSGGIDSTTCLAWAVRDLGAENVLALSMFYGQKHQRELQAAADVAKWYQVKHLQLDLSNIFQFSDNALLQGSAKAIPHTDYAEQLATGDGPVSTYVPFRNGVFISVAASVAIAHGCNRLYYGAHADDAAGFAYPDCSEAFNHAMAEAIKQGTCGQLKLIAPFVQDNKAGVIAHGLHFGVPYHLTWSCYEGGAEPCGECGTCRDRQEAFRINGVEDPLAYPQKPTNNGDETK